jgi:energy-coupling factor transporter ATP-binding protein EcfA2
VSNSPPLRLESIRICGYRAFPHPVEIPLKGKSLVLYGENGSGKSSLGKAVRDLLDYRAAAVPFGTYQYRHANPPREDRCVTLTFTDGAKPPLVWTHEKRDAAHTEFRDMARSRGWLDYRVVWRAGEVQYGDSVEIFRPLIEDILPGCQRGAANETFGQAWEKIVEMAGKKPMRQYRHRAQLVRLQAAIKEFNDSLRGFLSELEQHANQLLAAFAPWTTMELKWGSDVDYQTGRHGDKLGLGSIRLRMLDRGGVPLKTPSEFLNEARVTAIGLCLYLAGMARSIPPLRTDGTTYPRLLILDDVLLSLDMAHRLPLLRILRERFDKWQVLLLTHDRAWYEIAKQQLNGWAHHELFTQQVGDYEQPLSRADNDHLCKAIDFLHEGHVKAAAVHVRTKFEEVLKHACVNLGVKVPFSTNPRAVKANDLWSSLLAHDVADLPPPKSFQKDGATYVFRPRPQEAKIADVKLQEAIRHSLSWVLNPLSHSETVASFRKEIEDAIFAVADLEAAVHKACARQEVLTQHERAHLLAIISKGPPPP